MGETNEGFSRKNWRPSPQIMKRLYNVMLRLRSNARSEGKRCLIQSIIDPAAAAPYATSFLI